MRNKKRERAETEEWNEEGVRLEMEREGVEERGIGVGNGSDRVNRCERVGQ